MDNPIHRKFKLPTRILYRGGTSTTSRKPVNTVIFIIAERQLRKAPLFIRLFPYGVAIRREREERDRNKCIKWNPSSSGEDDRFGRGGQRFSNQGINQGGGPRREKKFSRTTAWGGEGARRREDRAILHVLVARVLYELWELRSAISAANAILMYASELMLEEGGGASNETFQRVSTFLLFETPCCLSRVRYEPEFPSNLRLYMYPSSVNSFFFPLSSSFFSNLPFKHPYPGVPRNSTVVL